MYLRPAKSEVQREEVDLSDRACNTFCITVFTRPETIPLSKTPGELCCKQEPEREASSRGVSFRMISTPVMSRRRPIRGSNSTPSSKSLILRSIFHPKTVF
ncbi:hypothetical protein RND81_09G120300 [Saponaria officinalis]|uniref:Uncharacterized protein n=1 Tax=Saponaria officinalis TaxID=3572 RepID=A0AAW1ILU1_SAPOF